MARLRWCQVAACVLAGCTPSEDEGAVFARFEADCGAHRTRIAAELATLRQHPWAGRYERIGEIWLLAPRTGYVVDVSSCSGTWPGHHGVVELIGPRTLRLLAGTAIAPGTKRSDDYHVVPWSERTYLVPSGRLVDFCNDVNSGIDARLTAYPARGGGRQRAAGLSRRAARLPRLPARTTGDGQGRRGRDERARRLALRPGCRRRFGPARRHGAVAAGVDRQECDRRTHPSGSLRGTLGDGRRRAAR